VRGLNPIRIALFVAMVAAGTWMGTRGDPLTGRAGMSLTDSVVGAVGIWLIVVLVVVGVARLMRRPRCFGDTAFRPPLLIVLTAAFLLAVLGNELRGLGG